MGCRNSNFNCECELFDIDINDDLCTNVEGYCLCEEDPDPNCSCSGFENEYEDIDNDYSGYPDEE